MIFALDCPIQHYAWGSPTAIPALRGENDPDGRPWAEMWMGAHPIAPSLGPGGESLVDLIARDPQGMLGAAGTAAGASLPFLFKILAAAAPLSIQCHPNKAQAEAGFAREEALGIDRTAPHRNYRDDNHKPELVVALGEFWALKGFRRPEAIAADLRRVGENVLPRQREALEASGDVRAFFFDLLGLDDDARSSMFDALRAGLERLEADQARWIAALLEAYPGDVGALAPLFLHLLRLDAGDALFLDAGELHAYLQGTSLEIMACSDNVLRGGLTPKHIDRDELMKVASFAPSEATILRAERDGNEQRYRTPCSDFSLSKMAVAAGNELHHPVQRAEILLALGGTLQLTDDSGGSLDLAPGQAAFCSADTGGFRVSGRGDLYIASTPPSAT